MCCGKVITLCVTWSLLKRLVVLSIKQTALLWFLNLVDLSKNAKSQCVIFVMLISGICAKSANWLTDSNNPVDR